MISLVALYLGLFFTGVTIGMLLQWWLNDRR